MPGRQSFPLKTPSGNILSSFLCPRISVHDHRRSGGRDGAKPIARLRNSRVRDVGIAHFLYFFCRLDFRQRDYILTRISERRCAKSACDYDAEASSQPTTQAGEPGCSCHGTTLRLFRLQYNKKSALARCPNASDLASVPGRERLVFPEKMLQAQSTESCFSFVAARSSCGNQFFVNRSGRCPT